MWHLLCPSEPWGHAGHRDEGTDPPGPHPARHRLRAGMAIWDGDQLNTAACGSQPRKRATDCSGNLSQSWAGVQLGCKCCCHPHSDHLCSGSSQGQRATSHQRAEGTWSLHGQHGGDSGRGQERGKGTGRGCDVGGGRGVKGSAAPLEPARRGRWRCPQCPHCPLGHCCHLLAGSHPAPEPGHAPGLGTLCDPSTVLFSLVWLQPDTPKCPPRPPCWPRKPNPKTDPGVPTWHS